MKLRLGTRYANPVISQFSRWLPGREDQFRLMAEQASKHGLEIEISPIKPKRTVDQNARYWVIVNALADFVGMSKAEMHNEILSEYHGFDLVEFRGSVHKRPRGRSHHLTRTDFSGLMMIAERWAAEMGVTWEAA